MLLFFCYTSSWYQTMRLKHKFNNILSKQKKKKNYFMNVIVFYKEKYLFMVSVLQLITVFFSSITHKFSLGKMEIYWKKNTESNRQASEKAIKKKQYNIGEKCFRCKMMSDCHFKIQNLNMKNFTILSQLVLIFYSRI